MSEPILGDMVSDKAISKRKKRKLEQLTPDQLAAYNLGAFLTTCCKDLNLEGAVEAYKKAKSNGIYPPKDSFNHLLALAAGLGEQGSGSFPVREQDPPSDIEAAFMVFEDARRAGAAIQEAPYSGLIRCCSTHGRKEDGLKLLREMQGANITPRNRTYSSLLSAYCASGEEPISAQLFEEMTSKYNLQPLEKDYLSILRLSVDVNNSSRFYRTLHGLMEDILVPSKELWGVLTAWFSQDDRKDRFSIQECPVDPCGHISACEYTLRSIELRDKEKRLLLGEIEKGVLTDEPSRRRKNVGEKWEAFKRWLENQTEQKTFDVILDGANIGYYQQNFAEATGRIDYFQIEAMVQLLRSMGRHPMIVLHCRHLFADVLPDQCKGIVDKWKEDKILYTTPAGCNDDTFWLYATVFRGCDVVTIDEMRDHHFSMLSPRWFLRWKERHQIKFTFGKLTNTLSSGTHGQRLREVEIAVPPPYSRRIQKYEVTSGINNQTEAAPVDDVEALGYFVPAEGSELWMCITPKNKTDS